MEVDLITGFLGVGKTTFIRSYLKYLEKKGQKAAVIENEFGSVDIDSQLLRDTGCPISSLAGECMCCTGCLFHGYRCGKAFMRRLLY